MSFLNRVRRIATYRFWISEIILKLIFPFLQRLFWLCSEVNSLRCCCFEHTSNKFVAKQIHDSDIIGDAGNHIDLYLCLQCVLNVFLASKCKCREVEGESVARKVKKKRKIHTNNNYYQLLHREKTTRWSHKQETHTAKHLLWIIHTTLSHVYYY